MKTLLPFLLLGRLAASSEAVEPDDQLPPVPEGKWFKLLWHDEFDGNKLHTTKWTHRPDGERKGGWWGQKAISLDGDGHLVITMFMDGDKPTDGYTSSTWTARKRATSRRSDGSSCKVLLSV